MTQPQLIEQILNDLRLGGDNVKSKETPAATSKVLGGHPDSDDFDDHFHYKSIIGKMGYLKESTRPDIAYAVHQCARFSHEPKKEHGEAIKWIGRYLKGTANEGIYIRPKC